MINIYLTFFFFLFLPFEVLSQEINENNQIVLRTVQDGKNDVRKIREVSIGEAVYDAKYLFVSKNDTLIYQSGFDFSQLLQDSYFIILYKNDTIIVPSIDKYICKGYDFMIEISYDISNTNPNNILISSNRRSCGDLYIIEDKSDLNSGYHLIKFENYKATPSTLINEN